MVKMASVGGRKLDAPAPFMRKKISQKILNFFGNQS
jgi:hypothetical protein